MKLYSYQERVLESIVSDPCHSQLISMPTGTGKTITFLSAIKMQGKKCLVLVHRKELLEQTKEKALKIGFLQEDISIISSEDKGEIKLLTIAMVQTLNRNLDKYDPKDVEMMVIDEAHHTISKSYLDIINHFKILEEKKLLLGFTATPMRGDGKALGNIFISQSFKMTLSEATQNGYIVPVHGLRIEMDKSLKDIDQKQGDYDITQLDKVMNCEEVNRLISNKCTNLSRVPAIIFCTSIDHAEKIAKILREQKRKAISVSYKTKTKTLEKILQMLKDGRIDFITNAIKLSEGFDHPAIQTVIIARPTRSPVLYKQMIGRGLRKYPGKYDCMVMEFSGNDEKMMRWEDIDENCTFQSTSKEENLTRERAIQFYKNRFGKDVVVLDVRVSPFKFYECYLRNFESYKKKYLFIYHNDGFLIGNIVKLTAKKGFVFFNIYCSFYIWNCKYKSFYEFGEPYFLFYRHDGWEYERMKQLFIYFCERQPGKGLGKWYPSEEEPMTGFHKSILGNKIKYSARKAEMIIDSIYVKKLIDKYVFSPDQRTPSKIEFNPFNI